MKTHDDLSHLDIDLEELRKRAERMAAQRESLIASQGMNEALRRWSDGAITVFELPPDPQNILRISIGGGSSAINYCSFRGDIKKVEQLLTLALHAIQNPK